MQTYLHTHSEAAVMVVCNMIEASRIVLLSLAYAVTVSWLCKQHNIRRIYLSNYYDVDLRSVIMLTYILLLHNIVFGKSYMYLLLKANILNVSF